MNLFEWFKETHIIVTKQYGLVLTYLLMSIIKVARENSKQ